MLHPRRKPRPRHRPNRPPPNDVHVQEYVYEPVRLTGRLSLKTTRQEITLLDGQVDMIAAFEMEVTGAQSLGEETAPDPMSRIWKFFKGPVPENSWKHP